MATILRLFRLLKRVVGVSKIPIRPYPDFLSPSIRKYLADIAVQAERIVVFGDHQWLRAQSGTLSSTAALLSPPDWPGAIIFLNGEEIRRSSYNPDRHDPIIAHEITHLQLLVEGWDRMLPNTNADDQMREKVRIVENWLTDPIINQRIAQRGFSLKTDRINSATLYLQELDQRQTLNHQIRSLGSISSTDVRTGVHRTISIDEIFKTESISQIRHFVSLSLEPDVSEEAKLALRNSLEKAFPEFSKIAFRFLALIDKNGFDTPEKYRHTAILCLQEWQVNPRNFRFVPHQRFTSESQQNWIAVTTFTEGNWDS